MKTTAETRHIRADLDAAVAEQQEIKSRLSESIYGIKRERKEGGGAGEDSEAGGKAKKKHKKWATWEDKMMVDHVNEFGPKK